MKIRVLPRGEADFCKERREGRVKEAKGREIFAAPTNDRCGRRRKKRHARARTQTPPEPERRLPWPRWSMPVCRFAKSIWRECVRRKKWYWMRPSKWFQPSRSAERVPCEQVFLNKTIEQKSYWTNPNWTNNYWTGDRLNKRSVDQILFENLLTEHLNNWTKIILNFLHLSKRSIEHITNWTLNKSTLNKYLLNNIFLNKTIIEQKLLNIEQVPIEQL